jgi:hypothetical protein
LSKIESELTDEVLLKDEYINKSIKSVNLISYEVESSLAKLLKHEIGLIEEISYLLDDFYNYGSFKVKSILSRVDLASKKFIDEIE